MDLGSGRRGVDMGPSAIRIAGLNQHLRELGHRVVDEGDLLIHNMEELKVGDVQRVMDGDLDQFIHAFLKRFGGRAA